MRTTRDSLKCANPLLSALAILALLILCAGCTYTRIHPLTERHFPRTPGSQDIELYMGKVERPNIEIAAVDSRAYATKDDNIKKIQLDDLKSLARKVGADAVDNIQLLEKKARGMVVDEVVPFPAWRQGEYKLYFLRGTAIKFVSAEEAEQAKVQQIHLPKAKPSEQKKSNSSPSPKSDVKGIF